MRVVFDTNVIVAALVAEGLCTKLLTRARRRQFLLFACPFILREFEDVLTRKFSVTKKEVRDAQKILLEAVQEVLHPTPRVAGVCRDPDDDQILACASAAEAEVLVSGDADPLELKGFGKTKILSPRDFEILFAD